SRRAERGASRPAEEDRGEARRLNKKARHCRAFACNRTELLRFGLFLGLGLGLLLGLRLRLALLFGLLLGGRLRLGVRLRRLRERGERERRREQCYEQLLHCTSSRSC